MACNSGGRDGGGTLATSPRRTETPSYTPRAWPSRSSLSLALFPVRSQLPAHSPSSVRPPRRSSSLRAPARQHAPTPLYYLCARDPHTRRTHTHPARCAVDSSSSSPPGPDAADPDSRDAELRDTLVPRFFFVPRSQQSGKLREHCAGRESSVANAVKCAAIRRDGFHLPREINRGLRSIRTERNARRIFRRVFSSPPLSHTHSLSLTPSLTLSVSVTLRTERLFCRTRNPLAAPTTRPYESARSRD